MAALYARESAYLPAQSYTAQQQTAETETSDSNSRQHRATTALQPQPVMNENTIGPKPLLVVLKESEHLSNREFNLEQVACFDFTRVRSLLVTNLKFESKDAIDLFLKKSIESNVDFISISTDLLTYQLCKVVHRRDVLCSLTKVQFCIELSRLEEALLCRSLEQRTTKRFEKLTFGAFKVGESRTDHPRLYRGLRGVDRLVANHCLLESDCFCLLKNLKDGASGLEAIELLPDLSGIFNALLWKLPLYMTQTSHIIIWSHFYEAKSVKRDYTTDSVIEYMKTVCGPKLLFTGKIH